jgi:ZIP family zinc transporter
VSGAFPEVLPYALGAAAMGVAGGVLSAFWGPGPLVRSYIQHLAAGLVAAAVAVEIIPHIREMHGSPAPILTGFAIGGMMMIAIKWFTQRMAEDRKSRSGGEIPYALAAAAAVDTGVDGIVIGSGFAVAPEMGAILTLALALELAFLTMSVGASLRKEAVGRGITIAATLGVTAMLFAGVLLATLFLREASPTVLATALAFGAAALLYLVAEELLVESHEVEESLLSVGLLFAGFLGIFAIELWSAR